LSRADGPPAIRHQSARIGGLMRVMASLTAPATLSILVLALAAQPAAASQHIYSYDSATPVTTEMTESGVSFIFDKTVLGVNVHRLMETQDIGSADLRRAPESALGRGGIDAAVGPEAHERALYEITDQHDGKALRAALCPGADHVWLALGRLKFGQDLRIRALGHDPYSRKTKLCVTLDYSFRGEWSLPTPLARQPDRTDRFNDAPNQLPY
jgi:hypothetical protein